MKAIENADVYRESTAEFLSIHPETEQLTVETTESVLNFSQLYSSFLHPVRHPAEMVLVSQS